MEKSIRSLTKLILAVVLIFIFTSAIPLLIFVFFDAPIYVLIFVFLIDSIILGTLYWVAVTRPILRLNAYLTAVKKSDLTAQCKLGLTTPSMHHIEAMLNDVVAIQLNSLMENLKKQILQTQDSSNIFLTEVQKAITNASRISLGADYIGSRVENLENLLDASLTENNTVKENIAAYGDFMNQQVLSIEDTGSLLDEITAGLNKFIEGLADKKGRSQNLDNLTEQSSKTVKNTIEAVSKISENVGIIEDTITIVASVAARTNLLAMNASIEAAHAGDSGLGFAVVAEEIRKLAEATSKQVNTITGSLRGMNELIDQAVEYTNLTGNAFSEIHTEVSDFVEIFDSVIAYYTELGHKNDDIHTRFIGIRETESEISERMENIRTKIDSNIEHLGGIQNSSEEIRSILERNTKEALQLSHVQAPIYTNAVYNAKKMEQIRKCIDVFHISSTSREIWEADKTELRSLINAIFSHLDWTIKILDFLHGRSKEILPYLPEKTTLFAEWLYGSDGMKCSEHSSYKEIITYNKIIHEKAELIERLTLAGKEQEATIEFSELLEFSRLMLVLLNELKLFIIKRSINPDTRVYAESYTEVDPTYQVVEISEADRALANIVIEDFAPILQNDIFTEELEELEELDEISNPVELAALKAPKEVPNLPEEPEEPLDLFDDEI